MSTAIAFEEFDVTELDDINMRWVKWLFKIEKYMERQSIAQSEKKILEVFMHGGYELEQIYNQYKEEGDDYAAVKKKIADHFNPPSNVHLNRYKFRNIQQQEGETFDEYAMRVRTNAKVCKFTDEDSECVSQIIQRCLSSTLKDKALTAKTAPTLKGIIELGRLDESIRSQIKQIPTSEVNVNQVLHQNRHIPQQSNQHYHQNQQSNHSAIKKCTNCGYALPHKSLDCPAKGKTCSCCGKLNHFAQVCRSREANSKLQSKNDWKPRENRQVHHIDDQSSQSDESSSQVWSITYTLNKVKSYVKQIFMPTALILIMQELISFNIDTGSQVDIIDEETFKKLKRKPVLSNCKTTLYAYMGKEPIHVLGQFETRVKYNHNPYKSITFIVTKGNAGSLLSYKTSVTLGIVKAIESNSVHAINTNELMKWKTKYPALFSSKIGLYRDFKAKLHIDESVQPRQEKLRHIPFHLRESVEKEIKDMIENDLIEPVPGPTPWISPIVPVPKRNGTDDIRICTDARNANMAIKRERHVTPTVDDLIVKLNGAKYISKIDLKKGYNQIMINEDSRYITAFCTHLGIYQYKRLNFGINTAAEIFQKAIESIICGIEGSMNISDDIIVSGSTKNDHDNRLDKVLFKLEAAGITVNENKCVFSVNELDFFGLHFSDAGVSIQESKIEALLNAKAPSTPSELRSVLGLANYCTRFIENLATLVHPLRKLLKTNAKWEWAETHENALTLLKSKLTSDAISYFNPALKSEIIVDASPVGLGVVFCQYDPEKPNSTRAIVQYASRTLSEVETRYSQVEKEALAVVWACEKLHLYLAGCEFDIVTDNKAVELIFGNPRSKPKARIERWCLRLLPYTFSIKHQPGASNIADYISRNPMSKIDLHNHEDIAERYVNMISSQAVPKAVAMETIIDATRNDNELQLVARSLLDSSIKIGPYEKVKNELAQTSDGLILRGNRICIPHALRKQIVKIAHQGHQGVVRTKQMVRNYVWFPGIDEAVENAIIGCQECHVNTEKFQMQPLQMSTMPSGPWVELSVDFYGPLKNGKHLMVLIDDYSRYPIVRIVSSTAATKVIPILTDIFSMFGIPAKVRSDNGPPFNGFQFKEFAVSQGFKHRRVTPLWPRANGLCERFMKNLSKVIKNTTLSNQSLESELLNFLRNYRATPHASTKKTPNQLLFKTESSTSKMPVFRSAQENCDAVNNDSKSKEKMKVYCDRKLKATPSKLKIGDLVLLRTAQSTNKAMPIYDPDPFTIQCIVGSQATIVRRSQRLRRNLALLKPALYIKQHDQPTKLTKINHTKLRTTVELVPEEAVTTNETITIPSDDEDMSVTHEENRPSSSDPPTESEIPNSEPDVDIYTNELKRYCFRRERCPPARLGIDEFYS